MFTKSLLITGCNRGLGLELVKQLANQTEHLFATCRKPDEAKELTTIAKQHDNITMLELDVCNSSSIESAKSKIVEVLGDQGLTCLINNAGQTVKSQSKVEALIGEDLMRLFEINVVAPTMLVKTFLPLLRKASSLKSGNDTMNVSRAAVINMSSILASIQLQTDNSHVYGYKMTKAALNMLTKNLSIELKDDSILVTSVHPGWVKTDMGGERAPLEKREAISSLIKVMKSFNETNTGSFVAYDGSQLPW